MADGKQLEILRQGVEAWNSWRRDNPDVNIDLSEAQLAKADLTEADFRGADLHAAYLMEAKLMGADLTKANLREANLYRSNLNLANLMGSILRGADLVRADLSEADLSGADLASADLAGVNLGRASLFEADLGGVNLWGANLQQVNFMGANLGASDVRYANLKGADLEKTIFTKAFFGGTMIGDSDLSESVGLDSINHYGPSVFGVDTIRKSKGKIPVVFLRGCGLSDLDIEYVKLATPGLDPEQVRQITYEIYRLYCDQPIQFYSCFISYNSKEQKFASRLHDDLQNNGVRCWFAPEDLKTGDEFRRRIGQEIRLRDKLLIILSKNSVASEWVGDEVEKALAEEKEAKTLKLFPIRLDGAVLKTKDDWAEKIRLRRHIGDFSGWKDEVEYKKAFERLLKDLKQ